MKRMNLCILTLIMLAFTACGQGKKDTYTNTIELRLSDEEILVNGTPVDTNSTQGVYIGNDIIYYESGKDFTYGEGSEKDTHSADEAAAHTVIHITQAGTYRLEGTLSLGQIAVDLGEDAKENPDAVVTLILDGIDITCQVAPAIIFYNVYECGDNDAAKATKDVDTSAAGANIIVADGTTNIVSGSYVEKIYKPESVVINASGTGVEDAKKLHKYDGAFYSKMSMNITGEAENSGILNIHATNEGLDSELHLTINGGNINIYSGNDGINTNEDGVSVTTINGGALTIQVTGETGEGDGIDSNGWLVINGGTVIASACSESADAGIDSDMGIHINGGTVLAGGHMLDRIEDGGQTYVVFNFAEKSDVTQELLLKSEAGETLMQTNLANTYSVLVYSSPDLLPGTYTLWNDNRRMAGQSSNMMGGPDMSPEGFENIEPPFEGPKPPKGFEDTKPAFEGMTPPDGELPPDKPEGSMNDSWKPHNGEEGSMQEPSSAFQIKEGANMFSNVSYDTTS